MGKIVKNKIQLFSIILVKKKNTTITILKSLKTLDNYSFPLVMIRKIENINPTEGENIYLLSFTF